MLCRNTQHVTAKYTAYEMWGRSQEGKDCTCQLGHLHEASGVSVSTEDSLQQQQEALNDNAA